jgi:transcriptional regulator with XRE-family HTH domain
MKFDPKSLKRLRHAAGLSQQALADAAGLHRSAIAQYETGKLAPADSIMRLAQALRCEPRELFEATNRKDA